MALPRFGGDLDMAAKHASSAAKDLRRRKLMLDMRQEEINREYEALCHDIKVLLEDTRALENDYKRR